MADRPILFSAPMVRALLAGRKTQTRRVVKPQPFAVALVPSGNHLFDYREDLSDYSRVVDMKTAVTLCPYGQPGDRLWVRETWQAELRWEWTPPSDIKPGSPIYFEFGDEAVPACAGKRRPSIHMPRWASRITLEITGVRVERLQDISRGDAMAEGCPFANMAAGPDPRGWYAELWAQINGPGAWDANPWVWVIEFRRVASDQGPEGGR